MTGRSKLPLGEIMRAKIAVIPVGRPFGAGRSASTRRV